jgi:hypothetical protein
MEAAILPRLVVGLLSATIVLGACGVGKENEQVRAPPPTTSQPAAWTTYQNSDGQFSIRYPSTWERSVQRLTPILTDPFEIVSVGTYNMRPGGDLCAHLPVNALEDLGPTDAFLTIQEEGHPQLADYPSRPIEFKLGPPNEQFDGVACVRDPTALAQWWLSFRDGNRAFYVLVALGKSASEETRQQVLQTLNSFHVDG